MAPESLTRYFVYFQSYLNPALTVTQRAFPIRFCFLTQIGESLRFMNAAFLIYLLKGLTVLSGKVAFDLIKAGV